MTEDATFEDGREAPLRLKALDAEDLAVMAALVQDAVFPAVEMKWDSKARRFAILLNRFRWEDAGKERHAPERVQALLSFEGVLRVSSQGIDRSDRDVVLSILSISFEPGADGTGDMTLVLAGDGAIRLTVEAIDATLRDVTRPYVAPSKSVPEHDT